MTCLKDMTAIEWFKIDDSQEFYCISRCKDTGKMFWIKTFKYRIKNIDNNNDNGFNFYHKKELYYSEFKNTFTTREEAEKKLAEMKGK